MAESRERQDDLRWRGLKIIQNPDWFCFSIDAVLLAYFVTLKSGDQAADLGTGTGVIPLLLAARSRQIHTLGLEIHPQVVEMAQRTVLLNQLDNLIEIRQGDIKTASQEVGRGKMNLVTCNPPYAKTCSGKVSGCSLKASARTEILCQLEDVIREGAALLNSDGRLALVHRPTRLTDILTLMRQYGVEPKRLRLVCPLPGKEPNLVLVEGIRHGRHSLAVEPPLFVYQRPKQYSAEMERIFRGDFLNIEW